MSKFDSHYGSIIWCIWKMIFYKNVIAFFLQYSELLTLKVLFLVTAVIFWTEFNVCDVKIKSHNSTLELPICVIGSECHSFPHTSQTKYMWNVNIHLYIHLILYNINILSKWGIIESKLFSFLCSLYYLLYMLNDYPLKYIIMFSIQGSLVVNSLSIPSFWNVLFITINC